MFKLFSLIVLFSTLSAFATIEETGTYKHPTDAEIQQKRACFQDLEVQGCGTQDADSVQFQSCLSNVLDKLDENCKEMMLDLYGDK